MIIFPALCICYDFTSFGSLGQRKKEGRGMWQWKKKKQALQ